MDNQLANKLDNQENKFKRYKSINGEYVKIYPDCKEYIYSKKELDIALKCPITYDYFKNPVVILSDEINWTDGYVYERDAILKWIKRSNIDPMTGQKLPKYIKLQSCYFIKFICYCLEDKKDYYIFHSPKCDPRLAKNIMKIIDKKTSERNTPIGVIKKYANKNANLDYNDYVVKYCLNDQQFYDSYFELFDLSLSNNFKTRKPFENCKFINCIIDEKIKKFLVNCLVINTINNYTLEEYLFFESFFELYMNDNLNNIFNNVEILNKVNISIKNKKLQKSINIKKIFQNFLDVQKNVGLSFDNFNLEFFKKISLCKNYFNMCVYDNTNNNINVTSPLNYRIEKLKEAHAKYKNDKNFKNGIKKINNLIKDKDIIDTKIARQINEMRKLLNVECQIDFYGGYDFSFLNLKNKTINTNLKYDCFAYADLTNAKFASNRALCCNLFVNATLINTDFANNVFCSASFSSNSHIPIFVGAEINNDTLETINESWRNFVKI